jgi:hypothetical protein
MSKAKCNPLRHLGNLQKRLASPDGDPLNQKLIGGLMPKSMSAGAKGMTAFALSLVDFGILNRIGGMTMAITHPIGSAVAKGERFFSTVASGVFALSSATAVSTPTWLVAEAKSIVSR